MYMHCNKCGYDTGDFESSEELLAKVRSDGGRGEQKPTGMDVSCPKCGHDGDELHID